MTITIESLLSGSATVDWVNPAMTGTTKQVTEAIELADRARDCSWAPAWVDDTGVTGVFGVELSNDLVTWTVGVLDTDFSTIGSAPAADDDTQRVQGSFRARYARLTYTNATNAGTLTQGVHVNGKRGNRRAVGGGPLVKWSQGTFARTTVNHLSDAAAEVLFGPFAADVPCIARINGKNRLQGDRADTNNIPGNISTYTLRGTVVRTAGQPDPAGGTEAFKLEGLNTGSNDCFSNYTGVTADAFVEPALHIERISTSGVIFYKNGADAARGNWSIDLAVLGSGPKYVTAQHAAVTVITAFQNTAGGGMGSHIGGVSGGALDIIVWQPQQVEGAFPSSPIAEGATRAADSMQFPASLVRSGFRNKRWTAEVTTEHASADLGSGDIHYIFFLDANNYLAIIEDGGGNVQVVWKTTSGTIVKTVTYPRDNVGIITVDFVTAELITAGFTTGNGTTSGTVSDWPATTLYVMHDNAVANAFSGTASEPI